MLDDLFAFPILIADGEIKDDAQEERERFGEIPGKNYAEDKIKIVTAEAELPFQYFMGLTSRWLPRDKESFTRAHEDGVFDACYVTFANLGGFICPWSKEKFKKEFSKFMENYNKKRGKEDAEDDQESVPIITILKAEDIKKIIDDANADNQEPDSQ